MDIINVIALICSIILCVIGVASFVVSLISKGRQEGQLIAKMDICMQEIKEIRKDIKLSREEVNALRLDLSRQEGDLHILKTRFDEFKEGLHEDGRTHI